MKYIASSSFGADSCAMLIKLIEKAYRLDEIVFFNTGDEFDAVYSVKCWFECFIKSKGLDIPIVTIEMDESVDYLMFEKEFVKRDGSLQKGYSWCGNACRWMTSKKVVGINKYYAEKYPNDTIIEYIGYAADELSRIDRTRPSKTIQIYPLVEFGISKSESRKICRDNGIVWLQEGVDLYSILDRVSCKKCANKNLKELRALYNNCPEYWKDLRDAQTKTPMLYKGVGVEALEERFKRENTEECIVPLYDIFSYVNVNM